MFCNVYIQCTYVYFHVHYIYDIVTKDLLIFLSQRWRYFNGYAVCMCLNIFLGGGGCGDLILHNSQGSH